jgi:hypothetical protein
VIRELIVLETRNAGVPADQREGVTRRAELRPLRTESSGKALYRPAPPLHGSRTRERPRLAKLQKSLKLQFPTADG